MPSATHSLAPSMSGKRSSASVTSTAEARTISTENQVSIDSPAETLIAGCLGRCGLPADTDTALATRLLHAYVGGIMREWVLDKAAYDLAARARSIVDTIVAGLAANPPRRAARVRPRVRPRTARAV